MKMRCLAAAGLLAAGLPLPLAAQVATPDKAVPVLEPGNWMFSMQAVSNGKPEPMRTGEDCLDAELKDIGAYFAPKVEGADAKCETQRKADGPNLGYHLKCQGPGFTMEGFTRVTLADSRRVTIQSQLLTRTVQGDTRVISAGEALRTGPCRKRR